MSVNMAMIAQEKANSGDTTPRLDMSLVDSESSSFLDVQHATTTKMKKEVSVSFHYATSVTSRMEAS
jgi:hypothetical protein